MRNIDNNFVAMGLDFGEKRIGVSVSQLEGKIALPHSIITYKKIEIAFKEISQIISDSKINLIVLGLPLTMRNEIGHKAKEVLEFKNWIEKRINVEIVLEDERLSTKQAKQAISKNSKNKFVDDSSATIILNSFLEKRLISNE
tara:strand:+ start:807 stop:1235 length:429 start_codon:yes stop_codon:yes gene_type:complete